MQVDTSDLKPNSHAHKRNQAEAQAELLPEKKKVEKVVKGKVRRKSNPTRKLSDLFISEEAGNVKEYVIGEIVVPTIKRTIYEVVKCTIETIFGIGGSDRNDKPRGSYVSYDKYSRSSSRREEERRYSGGTRTRSGYSFDDIILPNKATADDVLDRMDEIIEEYGMVSVADMYDLVGESSNYTDNKYGWTNLGSAGSVRLSNGEYILKLPKALPLN